MIYFKGWTFLHLHLLQLNTQIQSNSTSELIMLFSETTYGTEVFQQTCFTLKCEFQPTFKFIFVIAQQLKEFTTTRLAKLLWKGVPFSEHVIKVSIQFYILVFDHQEHRISQACFYLQWLISLTCIYTLLKYLTTNQISTDLAHLYFQKYRNLKPDLFPSEMCYINPFAKFKHSQVR